MSNSYFKNEGMRIKDVLHLSPKETLDECIRGAVILDVREEYETVYKRFDVPNVIYLPNTELKENYNLVPKDRAVIIADSVGLRSKAAVEFFQEKGYTNIANLNGGIVDWEQALLPMKIDANEAISGSCMCTMRTKREWNNK